MIVVLWPFHGYVDIPNKDFNKKTLKKVDCVCKQRKLSVTSGPLLPYLFGNFPAVPSKQIVLKCNKYWLGKAMARVSSGYLNIIEFIL